MPNTPSVRIEIDSKAKEAEPDYNDFYYYEDEECWQCGGEGFIPSCHQDFACVDPESGCDLCMRNMHFVVNFLQKTELVKE